MDKETEKRIDELKKELDKNCQHVFKQTGLWDGLDEKEKPIVGPACRCVKCGGKAHFSWFRWDELPKEQKIEKPTYR